MSKIWLGCLAVLPIAGAAMAADLPLKAPPVTSIAAPVTPIAAYDWNGIYAGAHFGWGWGETIVTHATGTPVFPTGFTWPHRYDGVIGGGQLGFNWQFNPNFLVGFEGEISASGIKGQTSEPSPTVPGTASVVDNRVKWMASATARLGYVVNNWLFYTKGGWGWANFDSQSFKIDGAGVIGTRTVGSETRNGWIVGGGIEWGITPNWSAKIEYSYLSLGTDREPRTITFSTNPALAVGSLLWCDYDTHIQTVKVALNYRFNWLNR